MDSLLLKLDPLSGRSQVYASNLVRLDGRGLDDYREVRTQPSYLSCCLDMVGSSYVSIGPTAAICAVSLQIGTPASEVPACGDIGGLANFTTCISSYRLMRTYCIVTHLLVYR